MLAVEMVALMAVMLVVHLAVLKVEQKDTQLAEQWGP
jgi:hypothetical protein